MNDIEFASSFESVSSPRSWWARARSAICSHPTFVGLLVATLFVGFTFPTSRGAEPDSSEAVLANGGLEELDAQGRPSGWMFPPALEKAGYRIQVMTENAFEGKTCVLVDATSIEASERVFGNLMQSIDATPFRGKRVRFRGAVRTAELSDNGRAQLWFRVDRTGEGANRIGAFDNMQDRPIRDEQWRHYEIVGQVDDDAARIHVGLLVLGKGKAWLDDVSLEVVSDQTPATGAALAAMPGRTDDAPQPFFSWWLLLAGVAIVLFALSQMKPSFIQRFAFGFSLAYWLLYCLPAPIGTIVPVWGHYVSQKYDGIEDQVVRWAAAEVLGIKQTLVAPNGSGDTTYDYVRVLVCFCLSLLFAAVWSLVAQRFTVADSLRDSTSKMRASWFNDLLRSYVRYVLAFIMLSYGLAKLTTTFNQFPEPGIDQLSKTYGDSSPMNLVWTFMGSSRPYTFFCGLGEVVGALLLIWRRTTMLGALVSAGVMLHVVMLNFCYDVPVKQYSAHLLLMALFVLLPDMPRLAALFVGNRPVPAIDLRPPYAGTKSIWVQRITKGFVICMGIVWPCVSFVRQEVVRRGNEQVVKPASFGSYEVESFIRAGQPVPPLFTDATRWRRVTLQRFLQPIGDAGVRDMMLIRMMDNSMLATQLAVSADGQTLTQSQVAVVPNVLTLKSIDDNHIVLSGTVQGQPIEAKLRRLNREDFPLVRRGFRWISEYPYNR